MSREFLDVSHGHAERVASVRQSQREYAEARYRAMHPEPEPAPKTPPVVLREATGGATQPARSKSPRATGQGGDTSPAPASVPRPGRRSGRGARRRVDPRDVNELDMEDLDLIRQIITEKERR